MHKSARTLLITLGALLFSLGSISGHAESVEKFVEGEHYKLIEPSVDSRDSSKIEVVEMFSYACIHCFNFDPYIQAWKKKQTDDVDFRVVPAIFNPDWERLAQAFYTAEALGVTDAVHERMFEGIHTLQEDLRQPEILAPLFNEKAAVEESDFNGTFNSFSVRARVQQAKALGRAYKITGVPTLVVNGKYLIDGRMAGGNARMLEVADYLVAKELAARK